MLSFVEAIAREEGFYLDGSRAQRNNNPGNLNYAPWMAQFGAVLETHPEPRFASFPTADQGWGAMRRLLIKDYYGLTVGQALNKWAPPVENQTNSYIQNVCKLTGLLPTTVLTAATIG